MRVHGIASRYGIRCQLMKARGCGSVLATGGVVLYRRGADARETTRRVLWGVAAVLLERGTRPYARAAIARLAADLEKSIRAD